MRSYFALLPIVLWGCPKDDPAKVCEDYVPPASFDAQNPKVSFGNDVMPIFKGSCAFTSCHGLEGSNNGIYLGEKKDTVYASIVNTPGIKLPSMVHVKPGDPRESFLMRKIDGSQCVLDPQCDGKTCGDTMPRAEELMDVETRDIIRRWIAQGAKND